jgi:phosphoribosylformylglycinamidine synthase
MKAGIIVFPGTNCDRDTKQACEFFGWDVDFIWHDSTDLLQYDVIFLPGGFSYGDYIRAGRLARFSPAVLALNEYIEKQRGVVVGICNGFQVLCERRLLPGILSVNHSTKFICDVVPLHYASGENKGKVSLPIAHAEGCFIAGEETLEHIKQNNMIFMQYAKNPNGSVNNIAGLYDKEKQIIGLMPHPERAIFKETGSTDGQFFFHMLEDIVNGKAA